MIPTTTVHSRAHQILHDRFGHGEFRPGQLAVIEAIMAGDNVLAVMPTGSGKSLCYQLPALLNNGHTLVISPLIALMKDQVDALQSQGIMATYINSSLTGYEQHERLRACRNGTFKLLYIAPERFRSARFAETIAQMRVTLLAVDEAHCISEWGHDFRPDYLRLREAIADLKQPQVLALTATATVDVQRDIMQQLGCETMRPFVYGFDRPNLVYRVLGVSGPRAKLPLLGELLRAQHEGSAIIYAATRRVVEEIATFLHHHGFEALVYHAGLPDQLRQQTQDAFMAREHGIIVATNAFGMGVDKSDVRCVIHCNVPRSLEAYYQEAGRAGRDGLEAQCVLLFSYSDVKIQEFLLEQSYPSRQLLEQIYELIIAQSRSRQEIPLWTLMPRSRRSSSEMQLIACIRLLEKAGYIERLSYYESVDDVSPGAANTLIRLSRDPVAPHQLALDDVALQRRKQHELGKLRRMIGYANARQCRREKILGYFGEAWNQQQCAACDNCLDEVSGNLTSQQPRRHLSEVEWVTVQKILSCVARMRGRYGRAKVIQVLMGSRAKDIRDSPLSRLSTYGLLKDISRPLLDTYLEALLAAECVEILGDEFPKLQLTERGQAVMRRQQDIQLALPTSSATPQALVAPAGPQTARPAALPAVPVPSLTPTVVTATDFATTSAGSERPSPGSPAEADYDLILLQRLQAQRTTLARAASLPAYCIFHNRTLQAMATQLPTDRQTLLQIHGIGEGKADKYGEAFLALIREYLAQERRHDHRGTPSHTPM